MYLELLDVVVVNAVKEATMAFVRYYVGDVVKMKKSHPCGSDEWEVRRIGTDFTIVCRGCGHQVMIARPKFEKAVKKIVSRVVQEGTLDGANAQTPANGKVDPLGGE